MSSGLAFDPADPAALYAECDWEPMNRNHGERWDRFAGFLAEHGLPQVYDDGGDRGHAFDSRLAATDLPVDKIARRCGAGSGDGLAKIFRKRLSISPTEYRLAGRRKAAED